jgi:hypothetical protein
LTLLLALVATSLAFETFPAQAQNEGGNRPTRRTDAQKKEDAEVDEAYRAATRGERGPAPKVDPWATVRTGGDAKKPQH